MRPEEARAAAQLLLAGDRQAAQEDIVSRGLIHGEQENIVYSLGLQTKVRGMFAKISQSRNYHVDLRLKL